MSSSPFNTVKALMLRPKVGGGVLLAVFLLYQVGMEMVFKGQLETIKKTDESIVSKTSDVEKRKEMVQRYSVLSESIKSLPTHLAKLETGESPKVKAVSLAGEIQRLIQPGGASVSAEGVAISSPTSGLALLDISAKEPIQQDLLGATFAQALQPKLDGQLTSVKVWEFPYTLQVKGSTIALLRLINELVQMQPLVVLNALELKLDEKAETLLKYAPQAGNASTLPTAAAAAGSGANLPAPPVTETTAQPMTAATANRLSPRSGLQEGNSKNSKSSANQQSRPVLPGIPALPGVATPPGSMDASAAGSPSPINVVSAGQGNQAAPVIMILDLSLFVQDDTLQP